jgi:hypothetical protein
MRERPWLLAAVLAAVVAAAGTTAALTHDRSTRSPRVAQASPMRKHAPRRHAPRLVEIAAVGDMTFGRAGALPAGGASALLARVVHVLHGDLTVGNLETTLGAGGLSKCPPGPSKTCFAFQAPSETAVALRRAGFAAVNVANNHSDDYGDDGLHRTSAALHAARLAYTGRPGQVTYVVRHGIRIALLGFAPYRYDQDLLDIAGATRLVRTAARHARVVVVFIHAGAEGAAYQHVRAGMETYLGEPRGNPLLFAHAVVAAGADVVLGSGPHVLRGMEWYRGRLIAFSLGNFIGYRALSTVGPLGVSAVLHVRLTDSGTFAGGFLVPVRLDAGGTPAADPSAAAIPVVSSLSREDFGEAAVRLSRRGGRALLRPPDRVPS